MRIIISPAMKMNHDNDSFNHEQTPQYIEETEELLNYLKKQDFETLKSIWKCNDKIALLNQERLRHMDLHKSLTPAIFAFEGIQYQYMAPHILQQKALTYLENHLTILSGFYGILRPFDGVVPYRLEMKSKLKGSKLDSLYHFWHEKLANQLFSESKQILNLASKEYSKVITPYLREDIRFVTCVFGEVIDGKVKEKGTLAKMARGEMVRFLAENQIEDIGRVKSFNHLNYAFNETFSNETTLVFIKES